MKMIPFGWLFTKSIVFSTIFPDFFAVLPAPCAPLLPAVALPVPAFPAFAAVYCFLISCFCRHRERGFVEVCGCSAFCFCQSTSIFALSDFFSSLSAFLYALIFPDSLLSAAALLFPAPYHSDRDAFCPPCFPTGNRLIQHQI